MGQHLSPQYGHVILASRPLFCQLSVDHIVDLQYQVPGSHTI